MKMPGYIRPVCFAWVVSVSAPAQELPPPATHAVDFQSELESLFAARCYDCHGDKKQESGFRADSREALLKGGDNGPAIIAGHSAESILVQVLADTHEDISAMPRKKEKFTPEQIGLVRAWIDQGAQWEGSEAKGFSYDTNHWAFKAPIRSVAPVVSDKNWARNPIDQFILAKLDAEKLKPSPEADKIALLRRLSLDLIGLPPPPEEVDAFLADKSPDADAKQVERPACLTALRREVGALLARRGALCRLRRLREGQDAHRLVLPRLGGERPQSKTFPTIEFVTKTTGRRPPAQRHAGRHRRHRFSAQLHDQRGRRH
jgi:mono/diheme cytochrome c family protein